ncbi:FAD-dependent oxidoreductase [Actinomycetospora termitidis]|uniref:D-amino-acid oxidase n=1 Tax=Actinomycetospora termitidis TaxID=3053470 RepID=A0ABT7MCD0_9PSEU|nr:FAD-dependent oxidoreductase [Actinomycetospora sp. Odt1-22]MDL5158330.1 FAD-dependent oxidoreductase [Actinomycetospora sp. Odt1-22]
MTNNRTRGREITVIGAGVIGLSIAVLLAEQGDHVAVVADRIAEETTSWAAGAMLGIAGTPPDDPSTRWAEIATPRFTELAAEPGSGIHLLHGRIFTDFADEAPPWARALPDFRALTGAGTEGFRSAMEVTLPFADMPIYLEHLRRRLESAGGRIERRRVNDLRDVVGTADVVVNAGGAGARDLCGDEAVRPVRGVHVVLDHPGLDTFRMEAVATPAWTNVFPYPGRVVVGGVALPEGEGPPDDEVAEAVLRRAVERLPELADARVRGHEVGWRPVRARPRLDVEDREGTTVVHAYGHGGIGVTVSWGVAHDVHAVLDGAA